MRKALPLVVIGLLVVAVIAYVATTKIQEKAKEYGLVATSAPKVLVPTFEPNPETTSSEGEVTAGVKTVSADVEYDSPGGLDLVGFNLTVDEEGTIVGIRVEEKIANSESAKYQKSFSQAIPSFVVGKKLTDLADLDVVGRASLTTDAFNRALPSLKKQLM